MRYLRRWRGTSRSDRRAAARADTVSADARALQKKLKAEAGAQKGRSRETAAAVEHLTGQLAELAEICRRLERRAHGLEQVIVRNRRDADRLSEFRRRVNDGSIARHVADAIAAAPLFDDPAPMLAIDGLFPDAVYDIFVAAIPPVDAFSVKDRHKADFRARKPQAIVPDLADAAWSFLDEDLIPRTIVPAIARRFAPFAERYYAELFGPDMGTRVAALPLEATDARLMLRRPGYHLDPHLDPKRVLMTGLVYFARPGDSDAHGTTFYRVSGPVTRDHASTYYPAAAGHQCELVRAVPFRRNSALVFLNSVAHGADIPATEPKDLERYALQFYVGPPVGALRELVRALPEPVQRTWAQLLAAKS